MSSTINASTASGGGVVTTADASGILQLQTAGTTALTIDTSQNVGIGTSSPQGKFDVLGADDSASYLRNATAAFRFRPYITSVGFSQISAMNGALSTYAQLNIGGSVTVLETGGTERMRIDSSGNLLVGTTSQVSPGGAPGVGNIVNTANNGAWALALQNNATTGGLGRGLGIRNATDFNVGSNEFIYCVGNTTARFYVTSDGGVKNFSANNSNISDERTKKDIEPAPSWLNKIDAIEVVNFKYKDQTHDDFNLGVIAQQVESVAPELVNIDGFGETPEDGIPLKSIYETDLMYAMLKSIQELKAIIDTQNARIEALEAKI